MVKEIDITELLVRLDKKNFIIVLEWLKEEGYTFIFKDAGNSSVEECKEKLK